MLENRLILPETTMKVKSLRLRNIRCFKDLTLELDGKSALLVGDNGDGKSTVLRSLAMGLCDESSASALFRELYGEFIREGCRQKGVIKVDLTDRTDTPDRHESNHFRTKTTITPLEDFERVDQKLFQIGEDTKKDNIPPGEFPWNRIFATGYGPGIRVHGTTDHDYYFAGDALYPLFVYDTPLQNPELAIRRISSPDGQNHAAEILDALKIMLQRILQLESKDSINLTKTGITVKTHKSEQHLSSSGDGYHATVTWVLDLLSWWYLRGASDITDIDGIVFIDEIEQHLHPRWQRNIMQLLQESFPNVQFIATTHSPLVASGCEGIPVHRLNGGEHRVEHPFGWRAEEVYEMMGLPTSRAESFVKILQEYQELDYKCLQSGQLSAKDDKRLHNLREHLAMLPTGDPVHLVTDLENIARLTKAPSKKET